jgi:hypothetical protein
MSVTATNLIYAAFRDLGVLRAGQTASTDTLNDSLTRLNRMLDSWAIDRLMIPSIGAQNYALVIGQSAYQIGPGAVDFNAPRPSNIRNANLVLSTLTPNVKVPMDLLDSDGWAAISVLAVPNGMPLKIYYDRIFDPVDGHATIYIWPAPVAAYHLEIWTPTLLNTFADLTTGYTFAPGYENAISKCLAVELAPSMGLYFKKSDVMSSPMYKQLEQEAHNAKAVLQRYNSAREDPKMSLSNLERQLAELRNAMQRQQAIESEMAYDADKRAVQP